MEKELKILKRKYKTWQGVADFLQITYRHLCYIRKNETKAGSSLIRLIKLYSKFE
jgi:hypothetical protein